MQASDPEVSQLFLAFSRHKLLDDFWPRLRTSVESLTSEQIWWRPNDASNSIGNLLLHLNGNVHQWLVDSFNGLESQRDRPAEFAERELLPPSILLDRLGATMRQVSDVLARLTEPDLLADYQIQGYKVNGLDAIYHVVEHFGMHYGQIVYITKMLTAADLGFYSDLTQTGRKTTPDPGRP